MVFDRVLLDYTEFFFSFNLTGRPDIGSTSRAKPKFKTMLWTHMMKEESDWISGYVNW